MVYFSSHLDTRDNMKHHYSNINTSIFLSVNKSINHHLVFQ